MKGIAPFIAYALVIFLSVTAIAIVLLVAVPTFNRAQDTLVINTALTNMQQIDSFVREVASEASGSIRTMLLSTNGGKYFITNGKLIFSYDTLTAFFLNATNVTQGNVRIEVGQLVPIVTSTVNTALALFLNQTNVSVYLQGGNGATGYATSAINFTNSTITNATITGYSLSGSNVNYNVMINSNNYTSLTNTLNISGLNSIAVYYNASDGTWRNITELANIGQGSGWSLSGTNLNYTLAGGDGYDYGIRDTQPGGSYWTSAGGNVYGKINISNDFITVSGNTTDFKIYNSTNGLLFNSTWNSILVDNSGLNSTYNLNALGNTSVYFFDWTNQTYKVWMNGTGNSTHGMPNWLDPRNKQEFKWRYAFTRSGYPSVNYTYLMTAQDPFVRVFVDNSQLINVVQSNSTQCNNILSCTVLFSSNVKSGNTIVVGVGVMSMVGTTLASITVTDSQGNSYTQATTANTNDCVPGSWNRDYSFIYYATASSGAADTITITTTSSGSSSTWLIDGRIMEVNGISISGITTANATGSGVSVATGSNGFSGTPLVFGNVEGNNCPSGGYSAGTSFIGLGTGNQGLAEYSTNVSSPTTTFPFTAPSSSNWADVGAVFPSITHNTTIPLSLGENRTSLTNADPGLVGYWNFNEGSGTTAADSSGNGNTGTLINSPTWITNSSCRFSSCLYFNGVNSTVQIPHSSSLKPSSQITLEAWVNPATGSLNALREIYRKEDGTDRHLLSFQDSVNCNGGGGTGGCISFGISTGGTYTELDVNIAAADWENKWSHVVATYDGMMKKIYQNGVLIGTEQRSGNIGTTGTSVACIGSVNSATSCVGTEHFNGFIDEVRVYNRALNTSEVAQLYQTGLNQQKPGIYFTTNGGKNSEEVWFASTNERNVYRTLANTTPSYFNITNYPAGNLNSFNISYIFNSTINNNFLFTLGTAGRINTANFSASTNSTGFSNETIESVANSTLTYYDLRDDSLVGWWKFNEGSGTTASDSSGFNNTGLINANVTWFTNSSCKSGFGYCLNFNGSLNYVNVTPNSLSPSKITLEAWINPRILTDANHGVIDKWWDGTANGRSYYIQLQTDSKLHFHVSTTGGDDTETISTSTISLNTWSHIGVTYDGTRTRIYINGKLDTESVNGAGPIKSNNANFYIGTFITDSSAIRPFNGTIDNVKVYNRPLSTDQILADYLATTDDYPNWQKADGNTTVPAATPSFNYDGGAAGIWHFDEGAGATTTDSSGNGVSGTVNATWITNSSCKFGSCLSFDGVGNYVITNQSILTSGSSFTVELWFNPKQTLSSSTAQSTFFTDFGRIFLEYSQSNCGSGYFGFRIFDSTQHVACYNSNFNANTWYHVVATFDNTNLRLYINGNLVSTTTGGWIGYPPPPQYNVTIGTDRDLLHPFAGMIDEVRVYSRPLTNVEIWEHYARQASNYYDDFGTAASGKTYRYFGVEDSNTSMESITPANTVLHLRFNDNSTVNVTDSSGYGNNGRVNGGTWVTNSSCQANFGGCMIFDGSTTNYIDMSNSSTINLNNSFSWGGWFNANGFAGNKTIIDKGNYTYTAAVGSDGTIYCRIQDTSNSAVTATAGDKNYSSSGWHQIFCQRNAGRLLLYADGSLKTNISDTVGSITGTSSLLVGAANINIKPSVVQSATGTANASTVSCTFSSNVASGDSIELGVSAKSTTFSSASDSLSTSFSSRVSVTGTNTYENLVTGTPTSSGSDTVTVTMSGIGWVALICVEVSGASSTPDHTSTGTGTTIAAVTSYTPTTNNWAVAFSSVWLTAGATSFDTVDSPWDSATNNMLNAGPNCGAGGDCLAEAGVLYLSGGKWTGGSTTINWRRSTGAQPSNTSTVSADFPSTVTQLMNGTLDEILVINRSLSADEVYQLYLGGYNRTINGHWHRVAAADGIYSTAYNLTDHDSVTQQDYDQRMLLINGTQATTTNTTTSLGTPSGSIKSLNMTLAYSTINITGTLSASSGSYKLCVQKTGMAGGQVTVSVTVC